LKAASYAQPDAQTTGLNAGFAGVGASRSDSTAETQTIAYLDSGISHAGDVSVNALATERALATAKALAAGALAGAGATANATVQQNSTNPSVRASLGT